MRIQQQRDQCHSTYLCFFTVEICEFLDNENWQKINWTNANAFQHGSNKKRKLKFPSKPQLILIKDICI